VTEIREVLRAWLAGAGLRTVAAQAQVDRSTARRDVPAAAEAGLARGGGAAQLSDELMSQVAPAGLLAGSRTRHLRWPLWRMRRRPRPPQPVTSPQ
jgi:hypothetical protein